MTTGFIMTAEIAEEFFKRCLEREAITEIERVKILTELVNEKKADAFQTPLGKESVIKRLSKVARVWRVSKRERKPTA